MPQRISVVGKLGVISRTIGSKFEWWAVIPSFGDVFEIWIQLMKFGVNKHQILSTHLRFLLQLASEQVNKEYMSTQANLQAFFEQVKPKFTPDSRRQCR